MTPEQQSELSRFPLALRSLVESELAAGNAIVEVGHSFPAPPAGAYIKLAKQVSTRMRATGDGLEYYERHSAIYSGEFSDAKRFYFVLEPPNPPPEPDTNAIRRSIGSHVGSSTPATPAYGLKTESLSPESHGQREGTLHMDSDTDSDMDSVAAIQQVVIAKFKSGACYRTSHKEGGTNIYWRGTRFVRADFGDFPNEQTFVDEAEFLKMLRRFGEFYSFASPGDVDLSEPAVWRRILSRLNES